MKTYITDIPEIELARLAENTDFYSLINPYFSPKCLFNETGIIQEIAMFPSSK